MGKSNMAPGCRFRPTDVELVVYYLKRKVLGKKLFSDCIVELDIYKFDPPDLPGKSSQSTGDLKWYFFCPREKKYPYSLKSKRSTKSGYWKSTGKDRDVSHNNQVVGQIRTLVFHYGKAPRGGRTDWVMHEYRLDDKILAQKNVPQDCYVLCVLYKKSRRGPKNGADYGAPFVEEDWNDDEEEDTTIPSDISPLKTTLLQPQTSTASISSPPLEVATLDDDDIDKMDQFFESLLVKRFENQNEFRHDEPCHVPAVDEAPFSLEDGNFSGKSDLSDVNDLFIELLDLPDPVITPAQAG